MYAFVRIFFLAKNSSTGETKGPNLSLTSVLIAAHSHVRLHVENEIKYPISAGLHLDETAICWCCPSSLDSLPQPIPTDARKTRLSPIHSSPKVHSKLPDLSYHSPHRRNPPDRCTMRTHHNHLAARLRGGYLALQGRERCRSMGDEGL